METAQLSLECSQPTPECRAAVGRHLGANRLLWAELKPGSRKKAVTVALFLFDVDGSAMVAQVRADVPHPAGGAGRAGRAGRTADTAGNSRKSPHVPGEHDRAVKCPKCKQEVPAETLSRVARGIDATCPSCSVGLKRNRPGPRETAPPGTSPPATTSTPPPAATATPPPATSTAPAPAGWLADYFDDLGSGPRERPRAAAQPARPAAGPESRAGARPGPESRAGARPGPRKPRRRPRRLRKPRRRPPRHRLRPRT